MSSTNFWQLSPKEIYMAIDGFSEFNGQKEADQPMDKNKLSAMMELSPD